MQLIASLSAAAAMVATVSAGGAVTLNSACDTSKAHAVIYNHCDYPVYLWSVFKGTGCPESDMYTLGQGERYQENLQDPKDGVTGISIKMSKTKQCDNQHLSQLEYFLESKKEGYKGNYLDMSYVDCPGGDCPTRKEGYYLVAGSQTGSNKAGAGNTWCPILSCHDAASCSAMSYVNPDDVQTKTCALDQNMELHLCGTPDKGSNKSSSSSSSSSSSPPAVAPAPSSPKPSPSPAKESSSVKAYIAAAAVTPVVELKDGSVKNVKTEVVYVTAYVNAKRHAHGHARRHERFHA